MGKTRIAVEDGQRFGMLKVLRELEPKHDGKRINRWVQVKCDCGKEKPIRLQSLRNCQVTSCGCHRKPLYEAGDKIKKFTVISVRTNPDRNGSLIKARCHCGAIVERRIDSLRSAKNGDCGCSMQWSKDGLSGTRLGNIWRQMLERCENPKAASYERYGAVGISVCEEWHDFKVFYEWQMQNGYADDLEIDRHPDKKGNYRPENVRWTTRLENQRSKTNSIWWKVSCVEYGSAYEAGEALGVSHSTIYHWCKGVTVKGKYRPPKEGCSWRWKYPEYHENTEAA